MLCQGGLATPASGMLHFSPLENLSSSVASADDCSIRSAFSPDAFNPFLAFFLQFSLLHFLQFCFGFSAWARHCQRSISVQIIQMQSTPQHPASRTILKPKRDWPVRWPTMARNRKAPSTETRIASQSRIVLKELGTVTGAVVRLDKHVSNENLFCLFSSKTPCKPDCLRIPTSASQENFGLYK